METLTKDVLIPTGVIAPAIPRERRQRTLIQISLVMDKARVGELLAELMLLGVRFRGAGEPEGKVEIYEWAASARFREATNHDVQGVTEIKEG